MQQEAPNCARCLYKAIDRVCRTEMGKVPGFCPTLNMSESRRNHVQPGLAGHDPE